MNLTEFCALYENNMVGNKPFDFILGKKIKIPLLHSPNEGHWESRIGSAIQILGSNFCGLEKSQVFFLFFCARKASRQKVHASCEKIANYC